MFKGRFAGYNDTIVKSIVLSVLAYDLCSLVLPICMILQFDFGWNKFISI